MRTTRRRYRAIVLIVSVLTVMWVATPVSAAAPAAPAVAANDTYTVAQDTTLTVAPPGVLANDGGDTVAVLLSTPTHGVVTTWPSDGSFVYQPNPGFNGVDGFQYGSLPSGTIATVTINVNQPPVANNDSYSVDEDQLLTVPAPGILRNDTDLEGDTIWWYTITAFPTDGTLFDAFTNGEFKYQPNPDFNGTDEFRYIAWDQIGFSNEGVVTITVNPVNDPPVARPNGYSVNEDTLLSIGAPGVLGNDFDVDGDAMRAVLDSGPSFAAAFRLNADGSFRYEPDLNYNGPDRFSYHATDGSADSATVVVDLRVVPVNDRPVAEPDSYATPEDTTLVVSAPGILDNDSDVEGDTLTPELRVRPAHGTLTAFGADGSFTYEPDPDFNGTDSFGYRVNDGRLNSTVVRVTINVRSVNDAPVAEPDTYRVLEDEILTIAAPGVLDNDVDVDMDTLTAHLDVAPSDGDLTTFRRNGSFVYEPDANFNGTDSFGYHANDGTANSNVARVTIIVVPVNDIPVAVGDEYRVMENERLVVRAPGILGNDTDADGDTLRAVLVDSPPNGDLTAFSANGAFTYVPDTDFSGVDGFTYYATDGTDRSSIVRVIINVIPDNEAPTAVSDEYDVAKNGELVVAAPGVLGNDSDPDGDTLSAVLDTAPLHGTLALNANGSFTYEPDAGFVGVDGFRYHANDGDLDSNIVRAIINVHYECNGVIATIVGTNGPDVINGTAGADVIVGLKGNDVIHGGGGDDLICGDGGFDRLYGDEGDDRLEGWAGNDRLFGGEGDDFLKGEGKSDLLKGGPGEDTLIGGKGFDRMFGNLNNDLLKSRDGEEDKLNGGRGFDTARIDANLDIWTSIEKFL